jgi:multiple sugar transport system ATP-binding protein
MAEIVLQSLHKAFEDFVAVRNTDLTIHDGEFFALLGPSGCGKTTTLRMIAGLEMPTSGRILLGGEEVTGLRAGRRDIAFVFQLFALYPHLKVKDNIAYPLRSQGMAGSERKARIAEVAGVLRIEHLLDKNISALAGGDRQRVALARAMVRRPRAFLMDEPLGTLDAEMRSAMREELRKLHDRIGATSVYVTHDQVEAMSMADRIAVMDKGLVLQAAPPMELYNNPATMFVASFVGAPAMNFIAVEGPLAPGVRTAPLADGGAAEIPVRALPEGAAARRLAVGIRPEYLKLADEGHLRGTVFATEYLGSHRLAVVETPAGKLRLRVPKSARLTLGETVGVAIDPDRTILFDAEGGQALNRLDGTPLASAPHARSEVRREAADG